MDDIKFRSMNELYSRVYPALQSKKKELHSHGFTYIKEEDIWNYCRHEIWDKKSNLRLNSIVNDILNTDNYEFDKYVKNVMASTKRKIYGEDEQ